MKYSLITLLLLNTFCSFSQTPFDDKVTELGIQSIATDEWFTETDATYPDRNHLNRARNFGLHYGYWDYNTGFSTLIPPRNYSELKNSFVLFTYPNSIGGLIQNPKNHHDDNTLYGNNFKIFVYDSDGDLISYFSSSGLDVNGNAVSVPDPAHHYYNQVFLDNTISTPFEEDYKWGASFPEQTPGTTLKIVFELYGSDNSTSKGFFIETTVSENVFLPYTKYNPWNDEVFGIVQTDAELQIKNISDAILHTNISTGSSSYNLPIADWHFAHTLPSSLASTEDVEIKIETKHNSSVSYSSTQKAVVYSALKSSIDYFKEGSLVPKVNSETIINSKHGIPNLEVTEVNRFNFDRSSEHDSFSTMNGSIPDDIGNINPSSINPSSINHGPDGDLDKFWLGTTLALADPGITIENKDTNWILPQSRQEIPISITNRQNDDWWGDLRDTYEGPSLNNYAFQNYIGINKIYTKDTGNFNPFPTIPGNVGNGYQDTPSVITGTGLSVANITQTWTYKNGQASFQTNQTVKFKVYGLRAFTGLPDSEYGRFLALNRPGAIKPWATAPVYFNGADSSVDYSNFADPFAILNTPSYTSPDFDERENFYDTQLSLSEINGAFRGMLYDGAELQPTNLTGIENLNARYPVWRYRQYRAQYGYLSPGNPFDIRWQRPITQNLVDNLSSDYNPAQITNEGKGLSVYDNFRNYAIRTSLPFAPQAGTQVVYDIVVDPHNKPEDTNAQLDQDYFVYNANTSTHTNPSRQLVFNETNWDEGLFVSFWNADNDTWEGVFGSNNPMLLPNVNFKYVINNDLTTDPNYLNAAPISDRFFLRDDDTPGIHADINLENLPDGSRPTSILINEGETIANVARIKLTAKPHHNVTVVFEVPNDGSEVYFAPPASITFTPENWNVFQSFDITANGEEIIQENKRYTINAKFQNPEGFHLNQSKVFDPDYQLSFKLYVINDDLPVSVIKLDNNGALEDFNSLSLYEGGLTTETPQGPTEASVGISLETPLGTGQEVYYNVYVANTDASKDDTLYKDLTQPLPYAFEVAAGVDNPKWSDIDNDGWRDFQEDRDKDGVYNSLYSIIDDYSNFNNYGYIDPEEVRTPDPSVVDKIENHKLIAQLTFTSANYNTPQYVTVSAVEDGIVDGDQTMGLFFDVDVKTTNDYDNLPIVQKELVIKDSNTADLDLDDVLDETDSDDDGDGCDDVDDDLPRDNSTCEDFDLDGISDADDPDDDGDGVADQIELDQGTDPFDICSFPTYLSFRWPANFSSVSQIDHFMSLDCDGDGYTNGQEYFNIRWNPSNTLEIYNGPLGLTANTNLSYLLDTCVVPEEERNANYSLINVVPSQVWNDEDCDDDGLNNGEEIVIGSDPYIADTDGDGINDFSDSCPNSPPGAVIDANGCSLTASWAEAYTYAYNEDDGNITLNWDIKVFGGNTTNDISIKLSSPNDDIRSRVTLSDGGSGKLVYENGSWFFNIPAGDYTTTAQLFPVTIELKDDSFLNRQLSTSQDLLVSQSYYNNPPYWTNNPKATINFTDNEEVQVSIIPVQNFAYEGTSGSYLVSVSPPRTQGSTSAVYLDLSSSDVTEAVISGSDRLTFYDTNPQTVTIDAPTDTETDGDITTVINFAFSTGGSSTRYNGISATANFTTLDIQTPRVIVDGSFNYKIRETANGTVSNTAQIGIKLSESPTETVNVVATTDSNEFLIENTTLSFDATNWDTPQDITITAIDDADLDGSTTSQLLISVDQGTDNFAIGQGATVEVIVNDDDLNLIFGDLKDAQTNTIQDVYFNRNQRIPVTPYPTFTVVLPIQPTSDVDVDFNSNGFDDNGYMRTLLANIPSITFTPDNWNTPQTITLIPLTVDQYGNTINWYSYFEGFESIINVATTNNSDSAFIDLNYQLNVTISLEPLVWGTTDTDNDGIPDNIEAEIMGNITDFIDGCADNDGDGATNYCEVRSEWEQTSRLDRRYFSNFQTKLCLSTIPENPASCPPLPIYINWDPDWGTSLNQSSYVPNDDFVSEVVIKDGPLYVLLSNGEVDTPFNVGDIVTVDFGNLLEDPIVSGSAQLAEDFGFETDFAIEYNFTDCQFQNLSFVQAGNYPITITVYDANDQTITLATKELNLRVVDYDDRLVGVLPRPCGGAEILTANQTEVTGNLATPGSDVSLTYQPICSSEEITLTTQADVNGAFTFTNLNPESEYGSIVSVSFLNTDGSTSPETSKVVEAAPPTTQDFSEGESFTITMTGPWDDALVFWEWDEIGRAHV